MIQLVKGYKDNNTSCRNSCTRNRSFDSGNSNYMIPKKKVKFYR